MRWTSIPSRDTPSRFILQKPGISAGTDEPSGSPNYDWDRLYLTLPSRINAASRLRRLFVSVNIHR